MKRLIDDVLTYSRITRKPADVTAAAAGAVVDQALTDLQAAIQESGATIIRDELPVVAGDASLLTLLFQNLISNAIKYRSDKAPVVRVSAEQQGGQWLFSVNDNGIGFDPQYAERIFGAFERLHPSPQYPGTGLGLTICKEIVKRYGGSIRAESQPGQGSTFIFTLPTVTKGASA
jgi:light-regulated signal transduction histidine kinase (bacteriophytochrome)